MKCNKPNFTIDAKGNQTDYAYDTTHGGVTTVSLPAPSSGAARPSTTYTYASLSTSAGALYRLSTTSTCASATSCPGTSNEVKTSISYGGSPAATNFLPVSTTSGAGDGSLSATINAT